MERGQSCICTCSFSYILAVDGSVSGTLDGYHMDILIGFTGMPVFCSTCRRTDI